MSLILKLLSGGFLAGYRTQVLGILLALQAIVDWLLGDTTLTELFKQLPEILAGLGLSAFGAKINNAKNALTGDGK